MKVLLRKVELDVNGVLQFVDSNIIGLVRIWIADTNKPTNYYLLFQDDDLLLSVDIMIDNADFNNEFNPQIQEIFIKTKTKLSDYGKSLRKGFCTDIKIPLSLVQKYQQRIG